MAIAAKISPAELTAQVTNRFVGKYYEARLINAPGTSYIPGTTVDATFLANEVVQGTGGYERQIINYVAGNVSSYSDDGVALTTKASVFTHDGSGTSIQFSHAALVEGNGNVKTFNANTAKPTAAINGTYTNLPTITSGSGRGLRVNLTITSLGASLGNYAVTVQNAGTGYAVSDSIQISGAVLLAAGAINAGAGGLTTSVATVNTSSNQLLAVAQTTNTVNLSGGNQTVFYWNLKQFGFYSV